MQASFWLTTACNLKCVYCYEGKDKRQSCITEEIINQGADLLMRCLKNTSDDSLAVVLHGGEPFLAFDKMKYLVETIKKRAAMNHIDTSFSCTTNATVLNDEIIHFIKEEIDFFTISMDGRKATQNYMRPYANGAGTFDIVEKRVKEFLKFNADLRIRMTYNHENVNHIFENVRYFIELGARNIVLSRDFFDHQFKTSHVAVLKAEIEKICAEYKEIEELLYNWKVKPLGACSGGVTSVHIDPEGRLYPCMVTVGHDEFCIGDVYRGIDEIKRDKLLSYSELENKECAGCDLYYYCSETRCKMMNKIINGDFTKASPIACAETNIKYSLMS